MYVLTLSTISLKHAISYHLLYKKLPNLDFLRVFGTLCVPCLRAYNKHKLQPRSTPCTFLGYALQHQKYLCLETTTGRFYMSRHVTFNESTFLFLHNSNIVTTREDVSQCFPSEPVQPQFFFGTISHIVALSSFKPVNLSMILFYLLPMLFLCLLLICHLPLT